MKPGTSNFWLLHLVGWTFAIAGIIRDADHLWIGAIVCFVGATVVHTITQTAKDNK